MADKAQLEQRLKELELEKRLAELEQEKASLSQSAQPISLPPQKPAVDPSGSDFPGVSQDTLESAGGFAAGLGRSASLGLGPLLAGEEYRGLERGQYEKAPVAAMGGALTGAILPLGRAKNLIDLGRIGLGTGLTRSIAGVGEQALDEPSTLTPGGILGDITTGTAIEAAAPVALGKIGGGFGKLGKWLKDVGKRSGETVVTGAVPSIAAKLQRGAEKGVNLPVPDIAEEAVKKGYMGAFTSPSEMVERVSTAGEGFGQKIGAIGEQLDALNVGAINAPRVQSEALNEFGKYAMRPELRGSHAAPGTGDVAIDIIKRFKNIGKGTGSFERAQSLKDLLREKGWLPTGKPRDDIGAKLYQRAYGMLSDEMERTVGEGLEKAPVGIAPGEYEALKKEYGFTKLLSPGFQRLEAKDIAGTPFGLREVMATTAGLATGGPAAAIAAGGAQKAFTRFGPQMLAVGGIKGGEALSKVGAKLQGPTTMSVLQTAGRRGGDYFARLKASLDKSGPAGVAVEHNKLMQTDPEYRKNLKEEQE